MQERYISDDLILGEVSRVLMPCLWSSSYPSYRRLPDLWASGVLQQSLLTVMDYSSPCPLDTQELNQEGALRWLNMVLYCWCPLAHCSEALLPSVQWVLQALL